MEFEPLLTVALPELAEMMNQAFRGYVMNVQFSPALLQHLIRCDAVDLNASRLARRNSGFVGIGLIARRGSVSRLAAMGVVPEARRTGVGTALMTHLIAEARARGERRMTLEVIEQNPAGVALYASLGFLKERRLVGYSIEKPLGTPDDRLTEVDLSEVARNLIAHGPTDLPWQLSGESLAQMGLPMRGFRLGPAYAALSDPEQPTVTLRALVVQPQSRRRGEARRLLRALWAHYPGKTWKLSPICPEELAPIFFAKLGFRRDTLSQFQMSLSLL